jgi:hypothetical protein
VGSCWSGSAAHFLAAGFGLPALSSVQGSSESVSSPAGSERVADPRWSLWGAGATLASALRALDLQRHADGGSDVPNMPGDIFS